MRRSHAFGLLALLPALGLMVATPGCGKKEEPAPPPKMMDGDGGNKGANTGGKKTELASTGWGTLSGTVTYDGVPPKPAKLDMTGNKNADACHDTKDPTQVVEQTWLVNPENKGVANVVVYLQAPEKKYFKIKDEDKKRTKEVTLHQPHCVFIPHVLVHFPAYYDPKAEDEYVRTGENLVVLNDAKFTHNTGFNGARDKGNLILALGDKIVLKKFLPDADSPFATVSFKCDIHQWMNAKALVFDHPYEARTDKDGKFEIKNVPTGVELTVVGWHETQPEFYSKATTLKDGKNELDLKIKAK